MPQLSDEYQVGLGVSILFASLVRALDESDTGIRQRFLQELHTGHERISGWSGPPDLALKMLDWTEDRILGR